MSLQWDRHIPTMVTKNAYWSLAEKYLETLEQVTYWGWVMFVKPRSSQWVRYVAYKQTRNAHYVWVEEHSEITHLGDWNTVGKVTLQNPDSNHLWKPLSRKPNHGTLCWGPSSSYPDIPLPYTYFNITPPTPLSLKWPLMRNFLIKISVSTYIFRGMLT
jgi:hypothetical protein